MKEQDQPLRLIEVADKPLSLTEAQTRVVNQLADTYLKQHRLDFNRGNFRAAFAVLGIDCLQRGMILADQTKLGEADNISPLIKRGLSYRERLYETVRAIADETDADFRSQPGSKVGAFALDRTVLMQARRILPNFRLTPQVGAVDSLVWQAEVRRRILPELAEMAISAVPKELFPRASLVQFPLARDQAGLVRNQLVSLAFRNTPLPVISTVALARFTSLSAEETASRFSAKAFLPDDDQGETREYLEDLLTQTREAFLAFHQMDPRFFENPDRLYLYFSRILLLLHPALEEERLITNPAKAETGGYSLWSPSLSAEVGDVRVPTVEGLLKAVRLFQVQGYETERFSRAIKAWSVLKRGQARQVIKRAKLERELAAISQTIMEIDQGVAVEMPPAIHMQIAAAHYQIVTKLSHGRAALQRYQKIMQTTDQLRAKTAELIATTSPMPQWVWEYKKELDRISRRSRLVAAEYRITSATALLAEDFETTAWAEKTGTEVTTEINRLSVILSVGGGKLAAMFGQRSVDEVLKYLTWRVETIDLRIRGRGKDVLPGDLRRARELGRLMKAMAGAKEKGQESLASVDPAGAFSRFVTRERLLALQRLSYGRATINEEQESAVFVPRLWSEQEAVDFKKQIAVSTIDPSALPLDALRQHYNDFNKDRIAIRNLEDNIWALLPKQIPSKAELEEQLKAKIAAVSAQPQRHVSEVSLRRMQVYQAMIKIINNSVFPLSEGIGLSKEAFWKCLRVRWQLIEVYLGFDQAKEAVEQAEAQVQGLEMRLYLQYLQAESKNKTEQLDYLATNPALTGFLRIMHSLDLAIEEDISLGRFGL